jgi:para-aminobenzoate synthetase component 1
LGINSTISRARAIEKFNAWGGAGKPFQFLLSFDGKEHLVASPAEAVKLGFLIDMPGWNTADQAEIKEPAIGYHPQNTRQPVLFKKHPVDPYRYKAAFDRVIEEIHYGNSFLLNLTFPTEVETNLSLSEIFSRSSARFRLLLRDHLVVFSPERFIRTEGRRIFTNPMKGTMDASVPGAYHRLMTDPKEDAEHNTIVDLLRNDLSTVASKVQVRRFKHIEKIATHRGELLQMSSEITGILPENYRASLGDILFSMLPAGSISGAPKRKTLQIIDQVENYERGFYSGIFGYFNGHEIDSAVAIRYLEKQGDHMIFKSGGGITFQSNWEKEYKEMLDKVYVPFS